LLPGEEPAGDRENCEAHPDGLWEVCEPDAQQAPIPDAEIDIPIEAIIVERPVDEVISEAEAMIRSYESEMAHDRRCADRARLESELEQKQAEIAQLHASLDAMPEIDEAASTASRAQRQAEYQSLVRELRSSQERLRQIREDGGMEAEREAIIARIYEYTGRMRGFLLANRVSLDLGLDHRQRRSELEQAINRATEERIEIERQLERARRQCQTLGD
jgi:hypothetical protein